VAIAWLGVVFLLARRAAYGCVTREGAAGAGEGGEAKGRLALESGLFFQKRLVVYCWLCGIVWYLPHSRQGVDWNMLRPESLSHSAPDR
jgi:hypothetical protein